MKYLLFFLLGTMAPFAFGLKYESSMGVSQWINDASPYACRLEHYIEGYGTGAFVHLAGEERTLSLDGQGIALDRKSVV